ncbi:hypothetical protein [Salmonella phage SSBI34]|nr:hypothetical protein [Salmonella phage SSBI34]
MSSMNINHEDIQDVKATFQAVPNKDSKMFWVFAGPHYYPCGGFGDFKGVALSIEMAHDILKGVNVYGGWYHIVDPMTLEVVESGELERAEKIH